MLGSRDDTMQGHRARAGCKWGVALLVMAAGLLFATPSPAEFRSLVQQAFELHQRGEYAQALPLLRRAYPLEPRDYFVNLLLGIELLRTGGATEALPYLRTAASLRPKEEIPLTYLAEAQARLTQFGDSAETYLRVVRVAPESADAAVAAVDFALARFGSISGALRASQQGLAAEYRLRAVGLGRQDRSRRSLLEHAADLDPNAPGIWADVAWAALAAGEREAAAAFAEQALVHDANDLDAWLAQARLAADSGDWTRATERLAAVGKRSPKLLARAAREWPASLVPAMLPAGAAGQFFACAKRQAASCVIAPAAVPAARPEVLFREQRWEAVAHLPAPVTQAGWLRRGIALARLDECDAAIPALERGLAGEKPDVYGLYLLSWCYSQVAGRVANGVRDAGDASVHLMRGDILLRLQANATAAIAEYELARKAHGDDPAVLERLADAQFGAGRLDLAREAATSALRLDPQRLAPRRTLAKIAMQERDYAAALPYLREFVARDAADMVSRIELAKACAQTAQYEEAYQNLAPALEQGYPDEKGSLHYLLGTVLKKLGKAEQAEQAFAAAKQLSDAFQQRSYRDEDHYAQP